MTGARTPCTEACTHGGEMWFVEVATVLPPRVRRVPAGFTAPMAFANMPTLLNGLWRVEANHEPAGGEPST